MPFMVGVVESIEKVIKPGDAAAVLGRTGELAIRADGIGSVGVCRKLLLQHDAVLPAIAEIVAIDHLRARSLEHSGETRRALAFYAGHSHEGVDRFWPAEAPLAEAERCATAPGSDPLAPGGGARSAAWCRAV
jgi:hypothetical protein